MTILSHAKTSPARTMVSIIPGLKLLLVNYCFNSQNLCHGVIFQHFYGEILGIEIIYPEGKELGNEGKVAKVNSNVKFRGCWRIAPPSISCHSNNYVIVTSPSTSYHYTTIAECIFSSMAMRYYQPYRELFFRVFINFYP